MEKLVEVHERESGRENKKFKIYKYQVEEKERDTQRKVARMGKKEDGDQA